MRRPLITLVLSLLVYGGNAQCTIKGYCTTQPGTYGGATTWWTSHTYSTKTVDTATYSWQTVTLAPGHRYQLQMASTRRNYIIEVTACGGENLSLGATTGYLSWYSFSQDLNNYSCSGYPDTIGEKALFTIYGTATPSLSYDTYVYICAGDTSTLTDSATISWRITPSQPQNATTGYNADNSWLGSVYKGLGAINTNYDYMGAYGTESAVFTHDFGTGQPGGYSAYMCPDSSCNDGNDTFQIVYTKNVDLPQTYIRATSNYTGADNYLVLPYPAPAVLTNSTDATFLYYPSYGNQWTLGFTKTTGSFKTDINVCQMAGNYTYGWNQFHGYVYSTGGSLLSGADAYYQGTFTSDSISFGYSWGSSPPTMDTARCNKAMPGGNYYLVQFLGINQNALGSYKFRIRGSGTLYQFNYLPWGSSTWTSLESSVTLGDVTTSLITCNKDSAYYNLIFEKATGSGSISFNLAKQPKNPGNMHGTNDTVCFGNSTTLSIDTVDGTETQWYQNSCAGSGIYIGSGATITVTPDSSTTYYARNHNHRVAPSDASNVLDLYTTTCASLRIIVNSNPSAPTAPSPQNVCSSSSHTFTFSSVAAGSGGNEIEWATNSSFSGSTIASSPTNISVTVSAGAIDTVYIRSKVSATGCVSSAVTTTATNNTTPTATASNSGPYCSYGTISLTGGASGLSSYSWSGPNSFSSSSQDTTLHASGNGGTYTITVTSINGCSASASTNVTVNTAPIATATNTGPFCSYGTISLASGPDSMNSYSWSGPSSFTSSSQNSTRSASGNGGTYNMTITDSNGCTATAGTSVTVNTVPMAPTIPNGQSICSDTAYTFVFDSVFVGSGGDEIEWATNISFSGSTIAASPDTISVSVNSGSKDTIWIRSRVNATECVNMADSIINSVYPYPLIKTAYVADTMVLIDSSTNVVILNSQNGVLYNLRNGTNTVASAIGNGDSLILSTGTVDSNTVFNILGSYPYATGSDLIAGSLKVYVYINSSILDQTFQILMNQSDPNYYVIVDSIKNVMDNLKNAKKSGIYVPENEEFGEFYGSWKLYWANKVSTNGTNPGSFLPAYKMLGSPTLTLPAGCSSFTNTWNLEGPGVDPVAPQTECSNSEIANDPLGLIQNNSFVQQLWVNPNNHSDIIAATASGLWRLQCSTLSSNGYCTGGTWVNISKGSGGYNPLITYNISNFAVNPTNPDNIYVTTQLGPRAGENNAPVFFTGIFYTADGGSTWNRDTDFDAEVAQLIQYYQQQENCGNNYYSVMNPLAQKMAFSPDGNFLFALGYNAVFRNDLNAGSGWWTVMNLPCGSNIIFNDICFDPANENNIFIGSTDNSGASTNALLCFSSSGGTPFSWSTIDNSGGNANQLYAVQTNPNQNPPLITKLSVTKISAPSDVLNRNVYTFAYFNGTGEFNSQYPNADFGIYQASLDAAPNFIWNLVGWGTFPYTTAVHPQGMSFTVSNSTSSATGNPIIYLPVDAFYYSVDLGNGGWSNAYNSSNGSEVGENITDLGNNCDCNRHADTRHLVLFSQDNPPGSHLYTQDAANDEFYIATDGGVSMHPLPSSLCDNNLNDACGINTPQNSNSFFVNYNFNGLYGQAITGIDIDSSDPSYLVYSAIHHAIVERNQGQWQQSEIVGGDVYQVTNISSGTPRLMYTYNGGTSQNPYTMYIGDNSNYNITDEGNPYVNNDNASPIEVNQADRYVYVGMHDLLKISISSAIQEGLISSPDPNPYFLTISTPTESITNGTSVTIVNAPMEAFDVNEADDQIIYAAFSGSANQYLTNAIIQSTNGGNSWTDLTANFSSGGSGPYSNYMITDIKSDPNDINNAWISFGGFAVDNDGNALAELDRVWKTCDGGNSWQDMSTGLPPVPVNKLFIMQNANNILFAATDAGVYLFQPDPGNPCTGHWTCINIGLPPVPVVDLKVDYCKMKLYAGTQNWGIWSWDIPNELIQLPVVQINSLSAGYNPLSNSVIWNNINQNYQNTFDIQPGMTLHITGGSTIGMCRTSYFIVEPGAKLIVDDNSTITNSCNSLWGGIIVEGNFDLPQDLEGDNSADDISTNQGYVYLENAVIENALEGMYFYNPLETGRIANILTDGGIVRAVNSTFYNNQRSADFRLYHSTVGTPPIESNNLSFFQHCTFKVDNKYDQQEFPFIGFVKMYGTYGIQFNGCDFENDDNRTIIAANLGSGIQSLDASYTIQNWTSYTSIFKNLHDGVLVENGDPNQSVFIYDAQFTDNQSGVSISTANYCAISDNTFVIGHLPNGIHPDNNVVGVTFDNSSQFQFQQNSFNSDDGIDNLSPYTLIGSGFTNTSLTGLYDNQCYANNYHEITIANLANYTNRSSDGSKGLQFLCNTNSNTGDKIDFAVGQAVMNGITNGVRIKQGDPGNAAGNNFSTPDGCNQFYDSPNPITYFWSTGEEPTESSTCPNNNISIYHSASPTRTCPSTGNGCIVCNYNTGQINNEIITALPIGNLSNYFNKKLISLIDGGNTTALGEYVSTATSTNAVALYDTLVAFSPFVSTATLCKVATRTDIFPFTVIGTIMELNPNAVGYQPLLDTLSSRREYGSAYIDSLISHLNDSTALTNLQDSVSFYSLNTDSLSRDIIIYLKNDSLGLDHNIHRSVLASMNDVTADYMRVEDYWAGGISDSALALMDSIPGRYSVDTINDSVYVTFKSYLAFRNSLLNDSIPISNLDSTHVGTLNNLALNGTGPAARGMKAVLHFFYNYPYVTQLEIPTLPLNDRSAKVRSTNGITNNPTEYLHLYPNPTSGLENFDYKLPYDNLDGFLVVADMIGHTLYSGIVGNGAGIKAVDTQYWPSGLYLYKMSCGDKVIGSGKFEVIK